MAAPTNILNTGAAGFVGGRLSAALRSAFPDAKLVKTTFDLRNRASVERIVRETKPVSCFHLAATRPPRGKSPTRFRPSDIPLSVGDAIRARNLLGWAPQIPWGQTLTDVLDDWHSRVELDDQA